MKKTLLSLLILTLIGCNADKSTPQISLKSNSNTIVDDFSKQDNSWKAKTGKWIFENGILKQISTKNYFPLILLEKKQFANVDISVDFKPISGNIDASGGIVFRAKDKNNYYIVRANALEGNYRLYTFKNGNRSQIASASIDAPQIKKYHTMRVVAISNHIQAYLDGKLLIDHQDNSFDKGYVGLWTKADSITEFDNFKVIGE